MERNRPKRQGTIGKGVRTMTFREGSKTVLEGQGWITITADNVDSFGF